ncbi:MAG: NAD+ synthase [Armatimonadia bacterium]|nr:NAD+ synthase [Armatimonadia bacterium]
MDRFELDWERVADEAAAFIRERMAAARRDAAVIGLSGGIDSALSAFLTARALGPERLTAFMLPYRTSSDASLADALSVAEALGVAHEVIEITPMVDAYFERYPDAGRMRRANMMARQRMAVLYDQSERVGALVVGTGNLTEALLGYTTLWGDMASAFNPIGDLYKTQVRRLACHLSVPEAVCTKPPTADLWRGQTDEGELGFTYEQADHILARLTEDRMTVDAIAAEGFDGDVVARVQQMMTASAFKRQMPPSPELRGIVPPLQEGPAT